MTHLWPSYATTAVASCDRYTYVVQYRIVYSIGSYLNSLPVLRSWTTKLYSGYGRARIGSNRSSRSRRSRSPRSSRTVVVEATNPSD